MDEEQELNNDDIREAKKVKFGENVKGGDLDDSDDSDDDNDDDMEQLDVGSSDDEIEQDEANGDDDFELEGGEAPIKKKVAKPSLFINPLLVSQDKKKQRHKLDADDVSEGEWSQDEQDEKRNKIEKQVAAALKDTDGKKKLLGKRLNRDGTATDKENLKDFFYNDGFEEVPLEKMDGYSSMDSDDMANTRAIAKIMLRKKARRDILDSTYNRYNNFDDPSLLPQWFLEDEQKHYKPNVPITKE